MRPERFRDYSELVARIKETQRHLARIEAEYRGFLDGDFQVMGRKNTSAIVIAKLFGTQ